MDHFIAHHAKGEEHLGYLGYRPTDTVETWPSKYCHQCLQELT